MPESLVCYNFVFTNQVGFAKLNILLRNNSFLKTIRQFRPDLVGRITMLNCLLFVLLVRYMCSTNSTKVDFCFNCGCMLFLESLKWLLFSHAFLMKILRYFDYCLYSILWWFIVINHSMFPVCG